MSDLQDEYIAWLVGESMLQQARNLAKNYAGKGRLWQKPYAQAQPRSASARRSPGAAS